MVELKHLDLDLIDLYLDLDQIHLHIELHVDLDLTKKNHIDSIDLELDLVAFQPT